MAYEVLFVCTGNICRSPAAERLLRRDLDRTVGGIAGLSGVDVVSAGTGALVGEPISPPMAELVARAGGDVERFSARQLTTSIVRGADLVITMTSDHRRETVTLVPAAVQRTFVLGEMAHMLGRVDADEVSSDCGTGSLRCRAAARDGRDRQAASDPGGRPRGGHRRPLRTVEVRLRRQLRADPDGSRAAGSARDHRVPVDRLAVQGMRVSQPSPVAASRGTGRWRLQAAVAAVGFSAAFLLCYVVMVRTAAGQAADVRLFRLVFGIVPAGVPAELVTGFARAASVVVLAGGAAVLGIAAMGRRAWAALVAAVLTVGVSVALGAYLRDEVLTRPRFTDEPFPLNGLPSTHATAAAALTVAVVLLWPRHRPWWLVNTAGVVLLVVAAGNIVSQAHRPSDVVASFLLVGAVACGSLALAGPPGPRH